MSMLVDQPKTAATRKVHSSTIASTSELVAFCPKCKTLETLWFTGDKLIRTQRFNEENDRVYHDCGSKESCRLYRTF